MKHQMMFLSAETEKAPFNIEGGFSLAICAIKIRTPFAVKQHGGAIGIPRTAPKILPLASTGFAPYQSFTACRTFVLTHNRFCAWREVGLTVFIRVSITALRVART